jgi:hypothetical protein
VAFTQRLLVEGITIIEESGKIKVMITLKAEKYLANETGKVHVLSILRSTTSVRPSSERT